MRWHPARSATRSAPKDANDYSIGYRKMLESVTNTPTMTSATSSTLGEMPAPSSSLSAKNARRPRPTAPPPTTASSTTIRSRRARGPTSGPTTRKLVLHGQLHFPSKAREPHSSRNASNDPSTSAALGNQAASTRLMNVAIYAMLWAHLSCCPTLHASKMTHTKAEEARPFARTLPYLLL